VPRTNRKYWVAKIDRNRQRDAEAHKLLKKAEWSVVVIWECELEKGVRLLLRRLLDLRSALSRRSIRPCVT